MNKMMIMREMINKKIIYFYYIIIMIQKKNKKKKGFPLNLISSAGFIVLYLKQCYANGNIYSKHENEDKYKVSSGFQRFCMSITERTILKFILQYLCASLFYVNVMSSFNISYTMSPISYGFCTS